ncbi:Ferredoxin [Planctomycetales bacterium 10988]|nr:Ferredoxin [Planctomycetales bacterium 10988]
MARFTHHLFVCCHQRPPGHRRGCCDPEGKGALRGLFKAGLTERGLQGKVRANSAGCLDQCELGPTVVIYPQEIWYGGVQPEDVPRILDETVGKGKILEDLLIPDEMLNTKGQGVQKPENSEPDTIENPQSPSSSSNPSSDLETPPQ